ncbi:uncharacterized protein LOC135390782 [Ornithodoros turicata]|uniref:uncharacterized protein LOC135390782 n=1 Tax=Ornithodoros turicata TaxID=34597 RepID=UPI00313A1BD8
MRIRRAPCEDYAESGYVPSSQRLSDMLKLRVNIAMTINRLRNAVSQCNTCKYSSSRTHYVLKELQPCTSSKKGDRKPFTGVFPCKGTIPPDSNNRRYRVCEVTETQVLNLARAGNTSEAIAMATQSFEKGQTLSPKAATVLISIVARAGSTEGVLQISHLVKMTAPNFWSQHIGFEHYHAEAMYRSGDVVGSITKFDALFREHHHQRDKISNLLSFLAIYLTVKNLDKEIGLLSEHCSALAKEGHHQPLVNVWRIMFTSANSRHHVVAWNLLRGVRATSPFVERKIRGIVRIAIDRDDMDIVHRLLEVVLYLEIESCYTQVFSTLLEFYCDRNDVRNARATFDHAQSRKISLYPVTFYRYTCFLSSHGLRIPQEILSVKYPSTRKPSGPKFRF